MHTKRVNLLEQKIQSHLPAERIQKSVVLDNHNSRTHSKPKSQFIRLFLYIIEVLCNSPLIPWS